MLKAESVRMYKDLDQRSFEKEQWDRLGERLMTAILLSGWVAHSGREPLHDDLTMMENIVNDIMLRTDPDAPR